MMFDVSYWNWWSLAAILLMIEMIMPGVHFLWLAISAAIVGLLVFALNDIALLWQIILFGILSLVSVIAWLSWQKKHPQISEEPLLNQRMQRYIGRQASVVDPIVNGQGKAQLGDTLWQVAGIDCAAGTKVKVIGVQDSTILTVELQD